MAAALLFAIGLLPGFPVPIFAGLAALLAGLGFAMSRRDEGARAHEAAETERAAAEAAPDRDDPTASLRLDEMRLEVGPALAALVGRPSAALPAKIRNLRTIFAREYGLVLPAIRITDDAAIAPDSYVVLVRGVEVARGEVRSSGMMVIAPREAAGDIAGEAARDPTFGLDVIWTDRVGAQAAEARGLTVVDPESVITTHLTEIIKEHLPDLMTFAATKALIDALESDYRKLAGEIPGGQPGLVIQQVLQALLAERVSIRDLPRIVEAIAERAPAGLEVGSIVAHVRARLSAQICRALTDAQGFVPVITLNPDWETELVEAARTGDGGRTLALSPQRVHDFAVAARREIQRFAESDSWPALMVPPELRPGVRAMLERVSPNTQVISHAEVHRKANLKTLARIGA